MDAPRSEEVRSSQHRVGDTRTALERELALAKDLGFLGGAPAAGHIDHALGFAAAVELVPSRVLDLGSGGGVPGLVLATLAWPAAQVLLVDSQRRRTDFLAAASTRLGLGSRVEVRQERAEVLGRAAELRATFDVVVARSFAAPSVTAECAAPFLRLGGSLVVSEPPEQMPSRWPPEPLASLGLRLEAMVSGPLHFARLRQCEPCPGRFPRQPGVAERRPLWVSRPSGS